MIPLTWLVQAVERIEPHVRHTPLTYDRTLDIYLKWESHQVTGSFKARGAINKALSLQPWERDRGLVTASAGNHGQGLALAGQITGARVIVFASDHAVPKKVNAMRSLGAEVRLVPGGYGEAEQAALDFAASNGSTFVSPYNDGQIIAGQGTLGLEIHQDLLALDPSIASGSAPVTWITPAGGGGLVAGLGASQDHLSQQGFRLRLAAVQSEASPFLHVLYQGGNQEGLVELPSLADGLSGPVQEGSITVPMTRRYVNEFTLVTEAEIEHAIAFCAQNYQERIEGSAATALAAVLSNKITQRPVVVVLTGGNIEAEVFEEILKRK